MEQIKATPPSPLRLARMKTGIKIWRMAQQLRISQSLYSYWELGRRRCPYDRRREIADILGVANIEDIFPKEYDEEQERLREYGDIWK